MHLPFGLSSADNAGHVLPRFIASVLRAFFKLALAALTLALDRDLPHRVKCSLNVVAIIGSYQHVGYSQGQQHVIYAARRRIVHVTGPQDDPVAVT